MNIKKTYSLTNCNICIFSKPKWLTGGNYKKFRYDFFNNFTFLKGCLFNASEFANVSSVWGICFSLFSSSNNCVNINEFNHELIKSSVNYNIVSKSDIVDPKGNILIDDKLYNLDEWVKKGGIGIFFNKDNLDFDVRGNKNIKYRKISNLDILINDDLEFIQN